MAVIADIGAVLRLTPQDDLQIASGDGVYDVCKDETPFYFQVQGHLFDGQLFYGLFGPVLSGPSRYKGLICNILLRTDATNWSNEARSQVNFKVGRGVVARNHREHFGHPDGTRLEGPCISRFGIVEVVNLAEARDAPQLVVTVRPATGPDTFPEVELAGTCPGLVWLAEQILRVARAEPEQHTHLDAEACAPVYVSPDGWWLTISRSERLLPARQAEPVAPADGGRDAVSS
jgi:hypothetical protein